MRASDSSFQVRWLERTFEGGALKDTKRLTGLFSIVITPPRTVEAVRKNPLGIYVHAFNWSQDVTAGRAEMSCPAHRCAGRDRSRSSLARLRHPGAACRRSRSSTARPFKAAKREPEPKPPVKIVEVPKPLPLPGQLKPVPEKKEKAKDDKQPKERVADANAAARIEPAKDGYINAIQVYPYTKGALYQLYAAANQVTDIALEPGEKLVSVSAGDTVRWVVGDTTSGEGKDAIVHILVKPIGADLETNLVITTDRRTYHLEMRSSDIDLHGVGVVDLSGVRAASPSRSSAPRPMSRRRPSPTPASTSSSSSSATASRAMRRGSRGRCSTTAPRSTSSSRPGSPRARRRRCS